MKKLFLSVCLIMAVSYTFAQTTNVKKAEGLLNQETPDFKGAREAIKAAMLDETTKNDAKTYYIAGLIGEKENDNFYIQQQLKQKIDTIKKGKAIMESIKYYLIADSLDQLPDEKGKIKPRYSKKISAVIRSYHDKEENLYSYGAKAYNTQNYQDAFEAFGAFLKIPSYSVMSKEVFPENEGTKHIKYYTALSAYNIGKYPEAIKIANEMKNDTIRTNDVYRLLYTVHGAMKDTVAYLNILKEGFTKFKNDPWYLQTIINHYIFSGKLEDASKYLDDAIAQSPNAEYYAVKGNIEDKLGHLDIARAAFDKALQLDANSAEAHAGIGRLIFNKGVEMTNVANAIKDNKLYQKEKEKADAVFKEAMPYLQKALELKPNDYENKFALKQLYYRLDMQKEYDEISKQMN